MNALFFDFEKKFINKTLLDYKMNINLKNTSFLNLFKENKKNERSLNSERTRVRAVRARKPKSQKRNNTFLLIHENSY